MSAEDKILKVLHSAYGLTLSARSLPSDLKRINRTVHSKSKYPEYPRKDNKEIWKENLKYLVKYHHVDPYYLTYGFDARGFRDQSEYLPHREFVEWVMSQNAVIKRTPTGDYTYRAMLRDKYVFANYLASCMGEKCVVPTIALISNGRAFLTSSREWTDPGTLFVPGKDLVFKVLDGECADGVMLVECGEDTTVIVDGKKMTPAEYLRSIRDLRIIVQDVVEQHEVMKQFRTKSVNTIRAVTVMGKSGETNVFSAFLRLSASEDSFVDNRAKGGLGIGINLETGKLDKYGFPHDSFGTKTETHELSGIRFEGFQLPFWDDVVRLVTEAHKQFYEIRTIGWDVALTPDGPVLLEGNDDWEIGGPQDTGGGLKKRWKALLEV